MNWEQPEQEVARLVGAWTTAELRGDVAFLERVLADDFVGIGPLGFMLTKQEWLARHQSGDLKYASFTVDEVAVRVYGEAALVTCRQRQQATYRGTPVPGEFRSSLMMVRQEGRWRLASLQLSAMGQPFTPPPVSRS